MLNKNPAPSSTSSHDDILVAARKTADIFAGRADYHDRHAAFPTENFETLWHHGLGNLTLPVALGGLGADLRLTSKIIEKLGGGDASTALITTMHFLQLRALGNPESGWPEDLRNKIVETTLAGPALINALGAEPELGALIRGGVPHTRARKVLDENGTELWSITGRKAYGTGSVGLRWFAVIAAVEDEPGIFRIGNFLIPAGSNGLSIEETWDQLGMRATASHDVVFDDVRIPVDHVVGLRQVNSVTHEPYGKVWMATLLLSLYVGVAQAALDWLSEYVKQRVPANLGASLATLPRFQGAVGEFGAAVSACRQLVKGLAEDVDAGGERLDQAVARSYPTKSFVTTTLINALQTAMGLVGNAGLANANPLSRHFRDILCSRFHAPHDDMVHINEGKRLLGL